MMRIALLTYSTKPRGSVIHTVELAEALTALGQDVCIFALDKGDGELYRAIACDYQLVPSQPAPPTIDRLIQQRIQDYVDFFHACFDRGEAPYDIYHAQDCISANALIMLRSQGYPISHILRTVHHIEDYTSPYLQHCQETSIQLPDRCLCVSRHWQQQLEARYGLDAPLMVNGVNTRRFNCTVNGTESGLKERMGLSGYPTFLTVGGVEPRKNSIRLLQAFAHVLMDYPHSQLVIAGGMTLFDYADYRDAFFAEVERLGIPIGRSLLLPGLIPDCDMPVLYRCADTFVFPSVKEGWGLVVMEAIASGVPVITANRPPFTEFLSSDQALLIDVETPEAIASAMHQSLDPALRQSLISNSQAILPYYTWERSAQLHIQQYTSLLSNPQRITL
ncbi:MAG: MSMEG_0565 family glycosyltransferase [Elainellaceae cyanobacterium]